ncbi:hypothetical protein KUTeg_024807 [Tegillarca granosa]|uniref:DAGKc domain-containing protein n=1 Tax=Tegillarca granosa TaxID=220873 RepID=A0ABQ9E1G9_TEGGR|nr:hypothetical protein KUTeg_024807 [Tegillarca granosa]
MYFICSCLFFSEDLLRRKFCLEAKKFGDAKYDRNNRPRRITVFLNPAASSGKARKLFEKNAGPILYLAGLEVNVVKTEYEGQVKKFMSVLETKDTDGIVIAGGDGTLLEAVTGIMRKEDKSMRQNIPIGVIPLGGTNRFAQLIFGSDKEQVRFILESAMSVVHGLFKKVDVLKIKFSFLFWLVFTEDDEYPDEDNEYDEEFITEDMSSVELTLNSTSLQDSDQPIKAVEVGIGPSELSKSEFVSEG